MCTSRAQVALIFVLRSGAWVKGTWATNFGSHITITDTHWYQVASWGTSVSEISSITPGYIIAQNSATAAYNPSKWSKIEFHRMTGDKWGFCSSVYDADTAQAAIDTDTSSIYDASDAAKGCNGFGHTEMTAFANPFLGTWSTNYGAVYTVNATYTASVASWGNSEHKIEAYGADFILAQNPADDAYNPSLWTLTKFHAVGTGYGMCSIVYNGATAPAALTADVSAYDGTNAASGCNGFSHTLLTPA